MTLSPQAFDQIAIWLASSIDESMKHELRKALDSDPSSLENAFYTSLSFGTGGMRGLMGIGTNRMNISTVGMATQALVNYIRKVEARKKHSVVIGYDSRNYSFEFAQECARVIAGAGFTAYLFDGLRPAPMISFACRFYHATSAIMITASHNPPQYNGYKVYWADGGQVLPPHDTGIMKEYHAIKGPDEVVRAPLSSPLIQLINIDKQYLDALPPPLQPECLKKSDLKVLYSNLHGAGGTVMQEALERIGITNFSFVHEQRALDGKFPTTTSPNPEEEASLQLGKERLLSEKYDLFIATDPDADRLGSVCRVGEAAHTLNGNEIFTLMTEYVLRILSTQNKMPKGPVVIKSIVTTPLIDAICKKYGVVLLEVLPGFKYFVEKINAWEKVPGSPHFVLGGEEAYGTLYGTHTRDKDAIVAARLLVEIAAAAKESSSTLYNELKRIWKEYGVYKERLINHGFPETKEGREAMKLLMESFRANPLQPFAGQKVVASQDLLKTGSDLPRSDVLIYTLENEGRVIVRPSGTEPKVKIYIMTREDTEQACDARLSQLEQDIRKRLQL